MAELSFSPQDFFLISMCIYLCVAGTLLCVVDTVHMLCGDRPCVHAVCGRHINHKISVEI